MMRLLVIKSLIFLSSVIALAKFENWYFTDLIEGIVLQVDDINGVLLAQNLELEEADFQRTYREWLTGDYQVIEVMDLEDVNVGMHLRVGFDSRLESKPGLKVKAVDYEVVDVAFAVMDMVVPASMEVRGELTLIDLLPQTEGRLQVFSYLNDLGYLQELVQVRESEDSLELYFEGQILKDETQSFNLMYQVTDHDIVEYVHNQNDFFSLESESLLHTIIDRKIVLQEPLVEGNLWEQTFIFNGEQYTAETELVRVEKNADGKIEYETFTKVEDIEGFYEETYEERRTFMEGSGMTYFARRQYHNPLDQIQNSEDELKKNTELSVSLVTEHQEQLNDVQEIGENIEADSEVQQGELALDEVTES